MKAKKLICGALIGVTVCGSAMAASTEKRRKVCEKHPEKYVWVAKTETCVPINPCHYYDDADIRKIYCPDAGSAQIPQCGVNVDIYLLFDKYASKVLKTSVVERNLVKIDDEDFERVYGIKTADGGYIAVPCRGTFEPEAIKMVESAIWAHGYGFSNIFGFNPKTGIAIDDSRNVLEKISESECSEIVDMAHSLAHIIVTYEYNEQDIYPCVIMVPKSDATKYDLNE